MHLQLSWNPGNQEKYIILQHCSVMVQVLLTHILHMETISELIDNHMLDKDYYAAVEDYNHAVLQRYCQDCFQNGYFHNPVLSGIPDL